MSDTKYNIIGIILLCVYFALMYFICSITQ
jgi:hypothetical protein|nr:MAG TPA: hypothetical protein [Caudoviricetes sp.]